MMLFLHVLAQSWSHLDETDTSICMMVKTFLVPLILFSLIC